MTAQETSARDTGARTWWRAATTPRMLALLLVVVVIAVVCVQLGLWQWDRSGIRGEESMRERRDALMVAEAVPVTEVLAPQAGFRDEHLGRRVSLEGAFDAEQQVLVPGRHIDGHDALLVVTAFHVRGGPHDGAIMPVLRGWLPQEDTLLDQLETGADLRVQAPAPPGGRTEIVGMLAASEAAGSRDLAEGLAGTVSVGELAGVWGTPMYSAYLVLEEPAQPGGLSPAPSPLEELDVDRNLQSLAYAVEWWAFALFAVVFWVKVLRDNVREQRLAASAD